MPLRHGNFRRRIWLAALESAEEAGVAGDRQVTEMLGRHDFAASRRLVVVLMAGRLIIAA